MEELREKLRAELIKKGLPEELSNYIAISNESEIEGVLNDLVKLQNPPIKNFEDFLKENPEAKREYDRKVSRAIETYKKKSTKPLQEEDNGAAPEWAKTLFEQFKELKTGFETSSKKSIASDLWSKADLPASIKNNDEWFNKLIDLNSEVTIEDQLKQAIELITPLKQEVINASVSGDGFPSPRGDNDEPTDAEIADIVN